MGPLEFREVALRQAVAQVFAGRAEQAIVLPDVAAYPVTIAFERVTLASAVEQLARSAGVEVRREGPVLVFGRAEGAHAAPEALAEIVRAAGDRLRLRLVHFPLGRAATLVSQQIGGAVRVPPELVDGRITLTWEGAPDRRAAEALAAAAGAELVERDGGLTLAPPPVRMIVEGTRDRVTLDLCRAPFTAVAERVARLLGVALAVRAGVPETPVTFTVRDIPADLALRLLARWADATADEGVVVRIAEGVATFGPPVRAAAGSVRVTLDLVDIPLRHALRLLFFGSGVAYAVQPDVPDVPITLSVENVELTVALRTLVSVAARTQPGLTYWKERDVYVIGIRRPS